MRRCGGRTPRDSACAPCATPGSHLGGVEQEAGGGEEHGVREAVARGDGDDALQRALVARHLLLLRPKRAHRPRQREDFLRYLRVPVRQVIQEGEVGEGGGPGERGALRGSESGDGQVLRH